MFHPGEMCGGWIHLTLNTFDKRADGSTRAPPGAVERGGKDRERGGHTRGEWGTKRNYGWMREGQEGDLGGQGRGD